jgi:hypothetical protein
MQICLSEGQGVSSEMLAVQKTWQVTNVLLPLQNAELPWATLPLQNLKNHTPFLPQRCTGAPVQS